MWLLNVDGCTWIGRGWGGGGNGGGDPGGGGRKSMRDAGKTFDHLLIVVLLGMGRRGEGGMEVREEGDYIPIATLSHHQNDSCIKMGSDESHLNVSVGSDGQSHKTVSTNHNLFEEKGEPKRHRTEVLPLTSLTPYRQAKPAHIIITNVKRL